MKYHLHKRTLCLVLAAVLMLGLFPAVSAAPTGLRWELSGTEIPWDRSDRLVTDTAPGAPGYKPTDMVRVSIVLENTPTLRAGFSTMGIAANADAAAYDLQLHRQQKSMEKTISAQALGGKPLDVVWNLTLVSNTISANVPYGRLDSIRAVRGVRDVVLERQHTVDLLEPQSVTSGVMTGAPLVWQTGLTGAGTRIAIIDTGTDTDHQSFDNGGYLYALAQNAAEKGMSQEQYIASLDLLDTEEISAVLEHLNAYERIGAAADAFYINEKLPFGANYVDRGLTVDHDSDYQGSHGSHVAGIAAANRYVPLGSGYAEARQAVQMCGMAPDAQLITLKVFGNADGPFDSDYFAAIEDAIWLGCDSVNLSLGSGAPGASENPLFADLLNYMATTDTVVVMSAGNSGAWADNTSTGQLYADGVSFHTAGVPATYTNSLAVASVENDGTIGNYLDVAGRVVVYTEGQGYYNAPLLSLDTSFDDSGTGYDYVFLDGFGLTSDYEGLDIFGKIVFCARGEISFTEKAANAARLGAAAVVVCNNTAGVLGMDLSDYRLRTPCVSILRQDAEAIRAASEAHTGPSGQRYYTGSLNISRKLGTSFFDSAYYLMSSFSSWGVPGSLELKPEITAPGGNIWSVNGMDTSGTGYEMMSGTSMAAPQVTGMAALLSQYIRENSLDTRTGLSVRQLAQSLLMSTAQPLKEEASGGGYYSILNQGAGLARVDLAACAESYVLVDGMADGKVKVELGEDARREGVYEFSFTIHNLSDAPMTYALNADLFTQDLFDGGDGTMYLDSQTRPLGASVRFFSNGASLECGSGFVCDLNGDGATNAADADHLLGSLVGNADALLSDGDLDGDGAVTSYDAHVLLTRLSGSHQVEVPAGGSAPVQVRLELTNQTRQLLREFYPTGAYIEAFVFARPLSSDEGSVGVTHSIPVLGYYGSWTEPSMYDVGSYAEHLTGSESRMPYLYEINGIQSNFVSLSYGGREEYRFGGNPFLPDDDYLPQRNAFNNQKGWSLRNLRFSLIRSAAASMLLLENADTGERYLAQELGPIEGAYYHTSIGSWQNPQQKLGLGLDLEGFEEGTRLNLTLLTAPELYCVYDAASAAYTADWDALSDGAALTTSFTIDNTAPTIKNVELAGDDLLRVTARDNQYIAAVALQSVSGSGTVTAVAANQLEPGKEMTIDLDLSQVYGSRFQLVVYDYAENAAVCTVELELQTQRPRFTVIGLGEDGSSAGYMGLDSDGTAAALASVSGRDTPVAAAYAEGAVFEITKDGILYAAYDRDLYGFTCLGKLDPTDQWQINTFHDLAYNRTDGKLYGLFYSWLNNQVVPYLCVIDPHTGVMTVPGQMPIDANTITIDGKGNFYSTIYGTSQLYRYRSDVIETRKTTLIGQTGGYRTTAVSSLAWDHNTQELYWAYNNTNTHALIRLDPDTGAPSLVCSLDVAARGLYIAYVPESDCFDPTSAVHSVTLPDSAGTLAGQTLQLSAQVRPWNLSDDSLIWTSSNSAVAVVDENGLVTGISEGTAVITAASALDSTKSASCAVTVSTLDDELNALIWDQEGEIWWSTFQTGALPAFDKLCNTPSTLPLNATMVADGQLYASTLNLGNGTGELYRVDPETFGLTLVGAADYPYLDMAYAPSLGYGLAVYFNYVLIVDLQTGNYLGAWDWSEGIAADLVGITYYGSEFNSSYGTNMDYFLLLDAEGNVYLEAFLNNGYFNGPDNGYLATIGAPVDLSYFQGFHYDGAYVYWTRFHEADDQVELIVWDCDNSGYVYSMGFFETGVWPVGGLYTDAQRNGTMSLADRDLSAAAVRDVPMAETIPLRTLAGARGSLHAAAVRSPEEETLSVVLTVPDGAAAPTNGTLTVTFDPSALELAGVTGAAEAFAWKEGEEGTVSIAFADRFPLSGTDLAELRFRPLGTGDTVVNVVYGEWNQGALSAAEHLTVTLPEPEPTYVFTDVAEHEYYYEPIIWAVKQGITNGTSPTTFSPDRKCLRAQVVTFLWRAAGCPEPESREHPFLDLTPGEYYEKAVLWAVEQGITNGTTPTTFGPDRECTRAQVVTFLYRFMDQPSFSASECDFTDVEMDAWYTDAVLWALENGITNGTNPTTFGVNKPCTRAHAVTFLYRTMAE